MTAVEIAVAEHLEGTGAVAALVSDRVFQLVIPEGATLPAIRVQLIDDPRRYHLRGSDGAHRALVQVDAYAGEASGEDPYAEAAAVADAIDDAMSGQRFFAGSPIDVEITGALRVSRRPLYDPDELRQVRVLQEYVVWHRTVN